MKDLIELTKNISSRKYNSVEVLRSLDHVMEAKPSGLTRLLYERAFFPDAPPLLTQQQNEGPLNTRDYFFYGSKAHQTKITEFLKGDIFKIYPVAKDYWAYDEFIDFVDKYGIMYRECFLRGLRNTTRQRRSYKRYFEDINILIGEANYTDDAMMSESGKQMAFENIACLTMSINMYITAQLDYLHKGMDLELVLPGELAEHFMYVSYIYEMCTINRQQLIGPIVGMENAKYVNY